MLRVAEHAFRSDTGRQRTANEDAYYARAPLFAIADGMGGAQAGEVAAKIAADSFESAGRAESGAEAHLRSIAEAANQRIHSLAEQDSSRSGMGTTLTAAMVSGDEVSIAHVGDSRAYVLREGELRMLTSDHSLVEELRRQGRLTDEQALEHPQRSIITRALGPEREVEVDTLTVSARPGDVFLLCSDGLTSMIGDERIAEILGGEHDLEAATRRLVRDANDAGGRDNITVIAFRLADADAEAVDEDATLIGPTAAEAGLTPEAVAAGAERPATRPATAPGRRGAAPAPPKRRRGLATALKVGAAVLIVAGLGAAAVYGARQVYFLGSDEGGRMALYRGLPYDLPLDIELYSEVYSVPVQVASVPEDRRPSVTDHELRSRADAISLLDDLSAAAAEAAAPPAVEPKPKQEGARKKGNGKRKPNQGGGQRGGGQQGGGSGGGGAGNGSGNR